jgi:hypothetical protein
MAENGQCTLNPPITPDGNMLSSTYADLGRTSDSQRADEVGHYGLAGFRCQDMVRPPKPPSQDVADVPQESRSQLASVDFFIVHTVWFEVLFAFIVLTHDRRRVVHFNVTTHPTDEWTAQQMLEAFPFDTAPRYLLRDRDRIYDQEFRNPSRGNEYPRSTQRSALSLATSLRRHRLDSP